MLKIRKFKTEDTRALWHIKYNTIRKVNIRDYSDQQVQAWAPDTFNSEKWTNRFKDMNPFIAEIDETIVGYADIQFDGYIDHFFCHFEYQGQGVGKALMQNLFQQGKKKNINQLYSHVSITAKPFFEHFGFIVIKKQSVEIRGQILINFVMEKLG